MTDVEIAEMLEAAGIDPVKLVCCRCQTTPAQARVLSLMELVERSGGNEDTVIAKFKKGRWYSRKR